MRRVPAATRRRPSHSPGTPRQRPPDPVSPRPPTARRAVSKLPSLPCGKRICVGIIPAGAPPSKCRSLLPRCRRPRPESSARHVDSSGAGPIPCAHPVRPPRADSTQPWKQPPATQSPANNPWSRNRKPTNPQRTGSSRPMPITPGLARKFLPAQKVWTLPEKSPN